MKQFLILLIIFATLQANCQDTISNEVIDRPSNNYESIRTLQETKDFITRIINDHGWAKVLSSRRLKASFEGNLLRIVSMNKDYTEPVVDGFAYNFARVYKFQRISYREGDVAFLNIWVDYLSNENKRKFDKRKLVLEIHHHRQAEQLMTAFRHLNKLLLDMEEPVEKF